MNWSGNTSDIAITILNDNLKKSKANKLIPPVLSALLKYTQFTQSGSRSSWG